MKSTWLFAGLLAGIVAQPALAQYPCLNNAAKPPGRSLPPPDYVSSTNWQRLQSDAGALQMMAGVWYGENRAPQLGMVQQIYHSFQANGLYQYRDQTCGNVGVPCSQNYGTGQFRAARQQDGSIYFMVQVSDLQRTNQCFSDQVSFPNPTTMIGRTTQLRRTQ